MNTTRKVTALGVALILVLMLQSITPISAAVTKARSTQNERNGQNPSDDFAGVFNPTDPLKGIPKLEPEKELEIQVLANLMANEIVFGDEGVTLKSDTRLRVSQKQYRQLKRAIEYVDAGQIGISMPRADGSLKVYGNQEVLNGVDASSGDVHTNVSTWRDGYGLAIYFDPRFTSKLKSFDNATIAVAIGYLVALVCSTGVGCIALWIVTAFFWDQIWQWLDRRYFVDALTVHVPLWNWVYIQPYKSGAWFNGQWFRTWLWT